MTIRAQIAFDLSANGAGDFFTLDDPVKGVLAVTDQAYVVLPGASGNYLSVPDESALDITGDIDIRVRVALNDWTPSTIQQLVAKWDTVGNNRSWIFRVNTDATLGFVGSNDGTLSGGVPIGFNSGVVTGITDGSVKWVRVTVDVNNGAGGHTGRFYTSNDGSTWTQLGTDQTNAGTTSLYAGTATLTVGARANDGSLEPAAGKFYRAQILNGINGTAVLDVDTSVLTTTTATSFAAATGQTVTINKSGSPGTTIVLPASDYLLAGDLLTDVTQYVRGISVKRGRSRILEKFTDGRANITLDNRSRVFDPTFTAGPYFGQIKPRKQLVIDNDGEEIFTGFVEDWNFAYPAGGFDAVAEVSASDGFSILAQQVLSAGTATAQLSGARVSAELDAVGWSSVKRDIGVGQSTLDADVIPANTNVLQYLQKVETSEFGALFIDRAGAVAFRDRAELQAFTTGVTFSSGGIPYRDISVVWGTEEMKNSVAITYTSGGSVAGTAIAEDTAAQADYGVMDASYSTILSSPVEASALASWLVGLYSQPQYRIDSLTVRLEAITGAQKSSVLDLELGDVVRVEFTPSGIGDVVSQIVSIDEIGHEITADSHDVTFTMSQALASFILDDSIFGVLDDDILGF